MLAKVICKECDLYIAYDRFKHTDDISILNFRNVMMAHYRKTGHTLIELELNLEDQDTKGD